METALSLGKRIKELRMRMGMSQIELAQGVCTPSMISQIESDRARPSYKILFALSQRLEIPLERLLIDSHQNLAYVSSYKMARAMVGAKKYHEAIPLLNELLATPRSQIPTMEILFVLAECYVYTDQLHEAEQTLTQVEDLAVLRLDHHLLARTRLYQGLVQYKYKAYKLAVYHWQKGLEEADKVAEKDRMLTAELHYKLGQALEKLRRTDEAMREFGRAVSLYQGSQRFHEIGHVFLSLSESYRKHHDLDKVSEYAERAVSIFEAVESVTTTLQLQVSRAMLYAKTGRREVATELLQDAIAKFREHGKREEEGIALVELAKLEHSHGNGQRAEDLCRIAQTLLPDTHVYQGWVHRLLGRIAWNREEREAAIEHFEKAAACYQALREDGEYDETMNELSELYAEEEDVLRACHLLIETRARKVVALRERGFVM